jgi:predicted Zn finger-like uncharacterized protein
MLILCPSCNATYDVPGERMKPGGKVRCARCGAEWVPLPEVPVTDSEPPSAPPSPPLEPNLTSPPIGERGPEPPQVSAMDRLAAQPTRRSSAGLRAAWIISVFLLLAIVAAAYVWRGAVMQLWPASVRLYDTLGLAGGGIGVGPR